jgi:hypothetical protein
MSNNILYYSNYCDNCKKLLQILSRSQLKEELHFLCIDKRVTMPDGSTHLLIKNGQQVLLPPTITKVPALMLVNNGFHVLFGDQIYQHLQPKEKQIQNKATLNQGEPDAFSFAAFSPSGITSDQYSFLDMAADDLLAKGQGGLRQMHNYVNYNDGSTMNIETPPDNYSADKVDDGQMQQYELQRNQLKQ